jgi:predicted glycosyltransferase
MECLLGPDVKRDFQLVMILDPYLDKTAVETVTNHPLGEHVRFMTFVPDLIDIIRHADLVVSRAGYNTVNEILLTGAKAVLIPERHGSGEQELRVRSVPQEDVLVLSEEELLQPVCDEAILNLLNSSSTRRAFKFDKYAIGRSMIDELESWRADHEGCHCK